MLIFAVGDSFYVLFMVFYLKVTSLASTFTALLRQYLTNLANTLVGVFYERFVSRAHAELGPSIDSSVSSCSAWICCLCCEPKVF